MREPRRNRRESRRERDSFENLITMPIDLIFNAIIK